jgi:dTDP-4-dehydrorhamnose reductase
LLNVNKKILITGGTGLLALNWACAMRSTWQVVLGVHRHDVRLDGVKSVQLNLSSVPDFERTVDSINPDLIVHTAGMTHVDTCESDRVGAFKANAYTAAIVALVAKQKSIRLIHVSTDHLFDGAVPFCTELTEPKPLNAYATSKQAAEMLVKERCPEALILRTNFFCWGSVYRQSFSDWIINGLIAGTELQMFDDVFFTPILADELIGFAHGLNEIGSSGIFNVVGTRRISKYDFGVELAQSLGLPAGRIQPGKVASAHLRAARPKDMSLSNGRLIQALGRSPGDLQRWFEQLRLQELQGRRRELLHAVVRRGPEHD